MVYDDCLEFAKIHNRWPRYKLSKSEKTRYSTLTIEEKAEIDSELELGKKWRNSKQYKILQEYRGRELTSISDDDENKEMITLLRSYGLGIRCGKKRDVVEEYLTFYELHKRLPKRGKEGKKVDSMEPQEHIEARLYQLLMCSKEYELLISYRGVELSAIPKEHYEMVKKLRNIGLGLEKKEPTTFGEYVDFIIAKGREPILKVNPKTDPENYECDLKQRWKNCKEKIIYEKYKGILLEEIPEKDQEIVRLIRDAWIKVDGEKVSDSIIRFVKRHQREPIYVIDEFNVFKGKVPKRRQAESELRKKWDRCFEKQVLDRFKGIELEDIPQNYRKIVKRLREVGLGYYESLNTRAYINFVIRKGRRPKQKFFEDGVEIPRDRYTDEQKKEYELRCRWDYSEDKKIYEKLRKINLDELPDEYKNYRMMIEDLKEIEIILYPNGERKKDRIKKSKQVRRKNKKNSKKTQTRIKSSKSQKLIVNNESISDKITSPSLVDEASVDLPDLQESFAEVPQIESLKSKKTREEQLEEIRKKIADSSIVSKLKSDIEQVEKIESDETTIEPKEKIKTKKQIIEEEKAAKRETLDREIAFRFIAFVTEKGREPRLPIVRDGVQISVYDATQKERDERQLYRDWKKCDFRIRVEKYAGLDISGKVDEEEEKIITELRKLGYGLTLAEYAKFRAEHDTKRKQLLKDAKSNRDKAKGKNGKAKELEQEVEEELKKRGVSKDDE